MLSWCPFFGGACGDLSGVRVHSSSAAEGSALFDSSRQCSKTHILGGLDFEDETTWKLRGDKCWLWVAVLAQAAFFLVRPRRDARSLQALLGEEPKGVLGTDRAKAYGLVPGGRRQFCWAHLKRDFQAMVDRQNHGSK